MTFKMSTPAAPVLPQEPAPPPMFGGQQQQAGKKPQAKASQPTFLGSLGANPTNTGQKTLLGQ